jgi:hypothetical protein
LDVAIVEEQVVPIQQGTRWKKKQTDFHGLFTEITLPPFQKSLLKVKLLHGHFTISISYKNL